MHGVVGLASQQFQCSEQHKNMFCVYSISKDEWVVHAPAILFPQSTIERSKDHQASGVNQIL